MNDRSPKALAAGVSRSSGAPLSGKRSAGPGEAQTSSAGPRPDLFEPAFIADRLAALYDRSFGGKGRGRYRISAKHLRQLAGRRRLYAEELEALGRALIERGFVLIDMDSFFVLLSAKTFANYRRVNEACLEEGS